MTEPYITPAKAAAATGLTRDMVMNLIHTGRLPAVKPNGYTHLVKLSDLERQLAESVVIPKK